MIQASRPGLLPSERPRSRRRPSVWSIVQRRRLLLVLGPVLGLALGFVYYGCLTPVYESRARVLVASQRPSAEAPNGAFGIGYQDNHLATQILLIRSPRIVQQAVQAHRLGSLPSLSGTRIPAAQILESLAATQAPGHAQMIELTYRGTDPEQCATVLNAVIDSYQKFLDQARQHDSGGELVALVTRAKDELMADLREKEDAHRTFRRENPLLSGADDRPVHESRIAQIEAARSQLLITRSQLSAELQAIETALANGTPPEALLLTFQSGSRPTERAQPPSEFESDRLLPLVLERQRLLQDHGPDHPKVRALDRQIELARKHLEKPAAEPRAIEPERPAAERLAAWIAALRQQLTTAERKEAELNALLTRQREAAASLALLQDRDESYRNEIARTRQLFDAVVRRLEELGPLNSSDAYRAEVIAPAEPGRQIEPVATRVIGTAGLIAVLVSLGVACILEISDERFRHPEDIQQCLGVPILGRVPLIPSDAATKRTADGIDPALVAFHSPNSAAAEEYRAVRTALFFHTRDLPHKVVQVTSPNRREGKSTLAANLSIAVAQSGKTVLLIDADLRTPRVHALFGFDQSVGITSLLRGDVELRETIHPTPADNLWALPCGPIPANPSEMLSTPAFQELVEIARCTFDFVIIDTGALLAATDPSVVVDRVDGVLLALGIHKTSQTDAARAGDHLRSLGANLMGIVVMGADEPRRRSAVAPNRRNQVNEPASA